MGNWTLALRTGPYGRHSHLPRTRPPMRRRFAMRAAFRKSLTRVDTPRPIWMSPRIPAPAQTLPICSACAVRDMGKKLQDGATGGR